MVSREEMRINIDIANHHKCDFVRELGRGSFGVAFLVVNEQKEKMVIKRNMSAARALEFEQEFEIHKELTSQKDASANLIKVFSINEHFNQKFMFMEYGELNCLMMKDKLMLELNPTLRKDFGRQLVNGVSYIHSKGVVHRDIKGDNLLVTANHVLKIADFGMAEKYVDNDGKPITLSSNKGTLRYCAPEIFLPDQVEGPPTDIWSCGIIMFFLLTGTFPFKQARQNNQAYIDYENNQFADSWKVLDVNANTVIRNMLMISVEERATIEMVQAHPWFSNTPVRNDSI